MRLQDVTFLLSLATFYTTFVEIMEMVIVVRLLYVFSVLLS